jgi:hypothetical protein|nr:MAG TPA: protein of unknown function (DUF4376) [Caudoviricetes sp.]
MKKIKIQVDENRHIVSYCEIGELENSTEIQVDDDFTFVENLRDYILQDDNTLKLEIDVEYLKKQKREELKAIRTNKLYENITVNGDIFQVREQDLDNFWEVDYMLGTGEVTETDTRSWILADNSIKVFTYSQILNVLTEFIKRKARIFDEFGELSIKISVAKTVKELEAIKWD